MRNEKFSIINTYLRYEHNFDNIFRYCEIPEECQISIKTTKRLGENNEIEKIDSLKNYRHTKLLSTSFAPKMQNFNTEENKEYALSLKVADTDSDQAGPLKAHSEHYFCDMIVATVLMPYGKAKIKEVWE